MTSDVLTAVMRGATHQQAVFLFLATTVALARTVRILRILRALRAARPNDQESVERLRRSTFRSALRRTMDRFQQMGSSAGYSQATRSFVTHWLSSTIEFGRCVDSLYWQPSLAQW